MPNFTQILRGTLWMLLSLALAGCGNLIKQEPLEKQTYLLDSARSATEEGTTSPVISVRPLGVAPKAQDQRLVYRLSEVEYERDFYHNWMVSPDQMIRELTTDWLRASSVGMVAESGSLVDVDYLIEGNITQMHGDYRPELPQPMAVLEIRYLLVPYATTRDDAVNPSGTSLFSRTYRATVPLVDKEPATLVQALDVALTEVLTRFEADLHQAL